MSSNLENDGLVGLRNDGLVGLQNDGLVGLENDGLVGLENNGLVGLENNGLVGLENDGLDRDGLAMVVDDNCEFIFEGRSYRSYTDYVQARRRWTAGIFANSGMLAARSAIAEKRTAPGPRRAKNPRDDLAIPPPWRRWLSVIVSAQKRRRKKLTNARRRWLSTIVNAQKRRRRKLSAWRRQPRRQTSMKPNELRRLMH
jgi:hypothetical protein